MNLPIFTVDATDCGTCPFGYDSCYCLHPNALGIDATEVCESIDKGTPPELCPLRTHDTLVRIAR